MAVDRRARVSKIFPNDKRVIQDRYTCRGIANNSESLKAHNDSTMTIQITALAALLLFALVAGVAVAQSNLLLAAGLAGVIGFAVLIKLRNLALWIATLSGLVVVGAAQLYLPQLELLRTGVALLAVALGALAVAETVFIATPVTNSPPPPRSMLWLVLALLAFIALSGIGHMTSVNALIFGAKGYLQMWGLFLALALAAASTPMIKQLPKAILIIALIQLPFALHQYLVLVPYRIQLGGLIVAEDVVAGTFGAVLEGGGANAVLSIFLVTATTLLLAMYRNSQLSPLRAAVGAAILLIPIALNANLIAILYLGFAFMLLSLGTGGINLQRTLMSGLLIFILGGAALWANVNFATRAEGNGQITEFLSDAVDRNTQVAQGYGDFELNRLTVMTFWWEEHPNLISPKVWFGHGLGSAREPRNSGLAVKTLASGQYLGMGIGLTAISAMLWEIGVIGVTFVMGVLFYAFLLAGRLAKQIPNDAWHTAMLQTVRVLMPIIALSLFHKNFFVYQIPFQTLVVLLLGYLAHTEQNLHNYRDELPA